jgi:hypothetical protein
LYDNTFEVININQSEVGATLATKWNTELGNPLGSNPWGAQQPMIVSLKEGGEVLANASESTLMSPAWVVAACDTYRVTEIAYVRNGTNTNLFPRDAILLGSQVNLGTETPLYPELRYLRVFNLIVTTQDSSGCFSEYTAGTLNETSVGWNFVIAHAGSYVLSYRFTKDTLRQAGVTNNPVLDGMILTSLKQDGKTIWEKLSTFDERGSKSLIRGSWSGSFMGIELYQQYIYFPKVMGSGNFSVAWNATGRVDMWVDEKTLNGTSLASFLGSDGRGGRMTLNVTSAVYWVIFMASDQDFIDGGSICFDIQYPAGDNAVTYFEQASNYLN